MPAKSTAPPLTAAELRHNPDLDDLFGPSTQPATPKRDRGNDLFGGIPKPKEAKQSERGGPLFAASAPSLSAIPSPEAYGPGQTETGTGEFAAAVKDFVDAVKDMKEMNQGGKRGGDEPGPQAGGGFVPGGPRPGGSGFSEHTPEPRTTPRASTGGMGPWMAAVTRSMGS